MIKSLHNLKGQCHEIFCFWFFFINQFPPSPRVSHLDRFEFFRKFAEIFADQGLSQSSIRKILIITII